MNEPTPTITGDTQNKKKRRLFLPIAGLVLAIAVGGFVASRAGLDKALVKQRVDAFIVDLKEQGREQGRDIDITYADLEVSGGFSNKHVVMSEPVLTVKPVDRAEPKEGQEKKIDALKITTPAIEIYPNISTMTIKAREPINFADEDAPEKSLLKITSNTPHDVVLSQSKVGEVAYGKIEYHVPSEIDFTYLKEQQAEGAEEQTPTVVPIYESLLLTMAQGGNFTANVAEDKSGLGEVTVNLREMAITPKAAPEGALKLAEITGKWSNILNDKKLNVMTALFKLGPLTSDDASLPHLPVMLALDASYEGAMPKNAEAVATIQSPESTMTLKNFEISTKDAQLKATASFTASTADVLPVGTANINLTNVPFVLAQLRHYKVINDSSEALLMAVLTKITGTPATELKDAVIPLSRERNGVFKVGASTFEELFAVFLQQALQQKTDELPKGGEDSSELDLPLVPSLPPEDKPKLAPIEIPDPSVRG